MLFIPGEEGHKSQREEEEKDDAREEIRFQDCQVGPELLLHLGAVFFKEARITQVGKPGKKSGGISPEQLLSKVLFLNLHSIFHLFQLIYFVRYPVLLVHQLSKIRLEQSTHRIEPENGPVDTYDTFLNEFSLGIILLGELPALLIKKQFCEDTSDTLAFSENTLLKMAQLSLEILRPLFDLVQLPKAHPFQSTCNTVSQEPFHISKQGINFIFVSCNDFITKLQIPRFTNQNVRLIKSIRDGAHLIRNEL